MEKIVISSIEVDQTAPAPEIPSRLEPKLPPAIPLWARFTLWPLILVMPLLCVVAITLRAAMRGLPPRTRFAWTGFLTTLLTTSGLVTCIAVVLFISFAPPPSFVSQSLAELDERSDFTHLPALEKMSAKEVSEKLKPLVAVISPQRRSWLTGGDLASGSFGAGTLLQADVAGYLFVTARHVIDDNFPAQDGKSKDLGALVAMASGTWAGAKVIARHKYLDMALLWIPRHSGHSEFVQPIAADNDVSEGENIFVIGHPEGLRFTLSNGIISRVSQSTLQLTAPVSPGNSGGPVFDERGNLVAIVTSMVDKNMDPNAENLNFAVRADALLQPADWNYANGGNHWVADFVSHTQKISQGVDAHQQ